MLEKNAITAKDRGQESNNIDEYPEPKQYNGNV